LDPYAPASTSSPSTVHAREEGLLAHFASGATNAATDGITNLVKVIKRDACGFRNFENFRRRVLFEPCARWRWALLRLIRPRE
jgi:transposase